MSEELYTDAFVVTSIPFQDYDRIVTLYTQKQGLIKLMAKGANRAKSTKLSLCQPLTFASYVLKKRKGNFHTFIEGKLIDPFLSLRDSYDHLMGSFELLHIVLKSQIEDHPSPDVFDLLKSYLKQMAQFSNPKTLTSSFYLKILLHEGCFTLRKKCCKCDQEAPTLYFCFKDYYCRNCAPFKSLSFSQQELLTLLKLIQARSFTLLKEVEVSIELSEKIKKIFDQIHD